MVIDTGSYPGMGAMVPAIDGGEGGWSGGTHCAIVEVDVETGIVKVERYVAVEDLPPARILELIAAADSGQ
jgi:CO/xanthine dehydrogenase Mo-binding subunit